MPIWTTQPQAWGWFHILGIIIAFVFIFLGFFLGDKFKVAQKPKISNMILWLCSIFFISIEVLKEVMLVIRREFAYRELPFQICSLIIFTLPIMLLIKKESVKDYFVSFISFFCMTGAFFYFIKPTTALNSPYILISIRSFLWHWMILFTCTFLIESYDVLNRKIHKFFFKGYILWLVFLTIAVTIDTLCYFYCPEEEINFFYIAYGTKPFYPVLNLICDTTEKGMKYYPLYFFAFAIYYGLGTYLMFVFSSVLDHLYHTIGRKKDKESKTIRK